MPTPMRTLKCCPAPPQDPGPAIPMPSRITVAIAVTNPECNYLSTQFSANWVGNGWRGVFGPVTIGWYCKGLDPSGEPEFEFEWNIVGCGGGPTPEALFGAATCEPFIVSGEDRLGSPCCNFTSHVHLDGTEGISPPVGAPPIVRPPRPENTPEECCPVPDPAGGSGGAGGPGGPGGPPSGGGRGRKLPDPRGPLGSFEQ